MCSDLFFILLLKVPVLHDRCITALSPAVQHRLRQNINRSNIQIFPKEVLINPKLELGITLKQLSWKAKQAQADKNGGSAALLHLVCP